MAHAIHDPAVGAREPRGAHAPIDVAVRRKLPGAPPHVPDPGAVGDEAHQGLLDRVLRLRRASTPWAEQQEAYDRPGDGSRDHQREQYSRLHAGNDARLLPRVPLIAELEATGVAETSRSADSESAWAPSALLPAELLHVLMLPDFRPVDAIGSDWGEPADPNLRRAADRLRGGPDALAVLVSMLREADR